MSNVIYTFTTCGSIGNIGPNQTKVNTAYSGTNLEGKVSITTTGIQEWIVPTTGIYLINAIGASGADSDRTLDGLGANLKGEFNLTKGDKIKIAVGQQGIKSSNGYGAGGGGTFVTYDDNTPIIVAGGGGGSGSREGTVTIHASLTTSGNPSSDGCPGGVDGQGGQQLGTGLYTGGTGGGLLGDGSIPKYAGMEGKSFTNGAEGGFYGTMTGTRSAGGFGGGGANGYYSGAGGGGYSGGGGAKTSAYCGGGGGSYNSGDNQVNELHSVLGDGQVTIEYIPSNNSKCKLDNQWRNVVSSYVKIHGVWRKVKSTKNKVSGTWK